MPPPEPRSRTTSPGSQLGDGRRVPAAQAGEDGRVRQGRAVRGVVEQLAPGRVGGVGHHGRAATAGRGVRVLVAASQHRERRLGVPGAHLVRDGFRAGVGGRRGVGRGHRVDSVAEGRRGRYWRQAGQQSVDSAPSAWRARRRERPRSRRSAGAGRRRGTARSRRGRCGGGAVADRRGSRRVRRRRSSRRCRCR